MPLPPSAAEGGGDGKLLLKTRPRETLTKLVWELPKRHGKFVALCSSVAGRKLLSRSQMLVVEDVSLFLMIDVRTAISLIERRRIFDCDALLTRIVATFAALLLSLAG